MQKKVNNTILYFLFFKNFLIFNTYLYKIIYISIKKREINLFLFDFSKRRSKAIKIFTVSSKFTTSNRTFQS